MEKAKAERHELRSEEHVVLFRQRVRRCAAELGFSLVDQTKIVTAASEIARNTLVHGGGGTAEVEVVERGGRTGLRLVFEDRGRGIADPELAMRDGYTTGNGLGLGLGGAKRLVSELELSSRLGEGTRVTLIRWR
ncbi:anti-sigma regulatory factor [Myxococcota bacterium]|nr:anti-sigma regulatory factor [Myxococcota bacterium]